MEANNIIRVEDVHRNFVVGDETVRALRGVSFTIKEGEFVTIMGSSGSGKSTLLNLLLLPENTILMKSQSGRWT